MTNRGAEWRRWEPHIHAPGTVLNNQFGGGDPWEAYLAKLEASSPTIEAIAVTDYYVTESYTAVRAWHAAGRLPDVKLLFPNIELRLDVAAKTGFVNIHLLVSPDDADHLEQVGRLLSRLQFNAFGDRFDCTRADLIRLGKRADPAISDFRAALVHGATQFKVNFSQLREVMGESDWAKSNVIVAVAGGGGDGTSGVRQAADAVVRQEIEKFADVIFSSNVGQREFWLGEKSLSAAQIRERYDTCKPCLHGSDAHDIAGVGEPTGGRFSWIKGAPTFDALRQACIDPGGRAFVGVAPPNSAMPSQVISEVTIAEADWASTPHVSLNPGLVAIIGARGSGKTALADMIAAACDAITPQAWAADENASPSFLVRARPLVGNATAALQWGGGASVTRRLDGRDANLPSAFPRARYLSQQFVEELCSAKGASEGLIREIERVIFDAHPLDDRDGAVDFADLRQRRTSRFEQARRRESESLASLSERISDELGKENLVGVLQQQVRQKTDLIAGYTADLAKLVVTGSEAQAARHAQLNRAKQVLSTKIQNLGAQRRTYLSMQDEVVNMRSAKAPEMLREAQARYANAGLDTAGWEQFLLIYKGNVDDSLVAYVKWADDEIAKLQGVRPPEGDPNTPLVPESADLPTVQLGPIVAEMARLEKHINADALVRNQYAALAARIAGENGALTTLNTQLEDAQGAPDRRRILQAEREASYGRLFQAVIDQQQTLQDLYAPLMTRLQASSGTLQKLSFSVARIVDAEQWAETGERDLIDCRRSGPFFGKGSLVKVVDQALRPAWQQGDAISVQAAMTAFLGYYTKDLLAHAPFAPDQRAEFRAWSNRFTQWLFDTSHIRVSYEIRYDGVDIRKLSPGTRGIVLLLLYLALDEADDRPLIIDQPEENLDPKSIYDELVSLFVQAKRKRQVIMVTHNANLVINTDADQIIIAESGSHASGGLPEISYVSGGLDEADIRRRVCEILEGGEAAFLDRARRLRVKLPR
ncbi:TrlF family AAA-like ATPase [Brevundimonas vesicularis]|uniref:AAA family ATPase n=1 Tax=Brevundimonas vesicularis TaxID=41276 RepID=A0ABU4KUG1_BREVE|nr:AAA family ATPase [Brevundimonas vesicularis]MDX2336511.1 AAA family ATPase [Brevundimonas vesicularis]